MTNLSNPLTMWVTRIDWKQELIKRLASRKFCLALLSLFGTLQAWHNHLVDGNTALAAVMVFVSAYIIGQSYVDGKAQEAVPNEVQQGIINAAVTAATGQHVAKLIDAINKASQSPSAAGDMGAAVLQAVATATPQRRATDVADKANKVAPVLDMEAFRAAHDDIEPN